MLLRHRINLANLFQYSLFLILAVLVLGSTYVGFILNKSSEYAEIVNLSGKIRGNIQRFSKLYFAGQKEKCFKVSQEIENFFGTLTVKVESLKLPLIDKGLNVYPVNVRKCWSRLKHLVFTDSRNREEILNLSENCWKEANKITDFYQKLAQRNTNILEISYYLLILLGALANLALLYSVVVKKTFQELETKANFDALTGVYNRAALYEIYDTVSKKTYFHPLSLIIFDIDNFKKINDTYGHNVGDEVLKEVSNIVKKQLRRSDIFGRWGGEEFLILLPRTDLKGAKKVAEKLRKAIESLTIPELGGKKVTASFGVTLVNPGEGLEEAIFRADMALYVAKRKGKNRVEVST